METIDIKKIFGEYVFDDKSMKKYLSKDTYDKFKKIIKEGKELSPDVAKAVATAMCKWATDNGATHFTHWFQPLTDATAEKHDSFIAFDGSGKVITKLSGKELIRGEADGSSFPTGGIRATFEARGYTAWDVTSPCFIRKDETGTTLCIPTAFYSYTGEALDKKSILLRSMDVINDESVKLISLFGIKTKKVKAMLGPEQEYFLIDRDKYLKRKDLIYTGRTLFGALPPKGQEMDDHYYGAIRSKIGAFMNEVNIELWKLGVPAKTNHNEVAPAQHELAVFYDEANISCDHNQLVMEVLRKVASKYNFVCLLHEKPFDRLNGSGKHNNWSLVTEEGINLLSPAEKNEDSLLFLLILALIIKAVDENAEILRASASNVGNDRRLGGNEAPPTIISVFLGQEFETVLENIENNIDIFNKADKKAKTEIIKTGSNAIPDLYKDTTDRNRTSPFAFTGNKFEFRMVGSSDSCAMPVATINTIVAKAFKEANEYFDNKKYKKTVTVSNGKIKYDDNFKKDVLDYIRNIIKKHKRIIFNGNGYSKEWEQEAINRKLPIVKNMVEAIKVLLSDKAVKLFTSMGVMTEQELRSRVEVQFETYIKTIKIEVLTMINMVKKQIMPACLEYKKELVETINQTMNCMADVSVEVETNILKELSFRICNMKKSLDMLEEDLVNTEKITDNEKKADEYKKIVVPSMDSLRTDVDAIEMLVDKKYWPLPSYGDLIFEVSKV